MIAWSSPVFSFGSVLLASLVAVLCLHPQKAEKKHSSAYKYPFSRPSLLWQHCLQLVTWPNSDNQHGVGRKVANNPAWVWILLSLLYFRLRQSKTNYNYVSPANRQTPETSIAASKPAVMIMIASLGGREQGRHFNGYIPESQWLGGWLSSFATNHDCLSGILLKMINVDGAWSSTIIR